VTAVVASFATGYPAITGACGRFTEANKRINRIADQGSVEAGA
jgi:hypothetical protein